MINTNAKLKKSALPLKKAARDRKKVMVDRKTLSENGENFLHIVSDIDFRQLLGKTDTPVG